MRKGSLEGGGGARLGGRDLGEPEKEDVSSLRTEERLAGWTREKMVPGRESQCQATQVGHPRMHQGMPRIPHVGARWWEGEG